MNVDVLIIGAGFAGASTAFHLAPRFQGSVLIVDQEEVPGYHATGRNASLVLQSVENPEVREIVATSVEAYLQRPSEVGYRAVGSLLLGTQKQLEPLREPDRIATQYIGPADAVRRVPLLRGHSFERALWTPTDGVMDISQLLDYYLRSARAEGVKIQLDTRVEVIEKKGAIFQVQTGHDLIEAGMIVDAAGAWAPRIAESAGIESLPMRSFKRHLFVLEGFDEVDSSWPFVWSMDQSFYFRPESGGILFSVCDEELWLEDFVQTVNPEISEKLADLIVGQLPLFEEALQRRLWSCFRTKTPEGGFHLGWADQLDGFLWVAGLGGHGMGASWEVGRRAAELILNRD